MERAKLNTSINPKILAALNEYCKKYSYQRNLLIERWVKEKLTEEERRKAFYHEKTTEVIQNDAADKSY